MMSTASGTSTTSTVQSQRDFAPVPLRRPVLLRCGHADAEIKEQRRRGEIRNVRPGLYLPAQQMDAISAEQRHRVLILGLVPQLRPGSVVSHTSAAVMLGLPLWRTRLSRVHVSRFMREGTRASTWVQPHAVSAAMPSVLVDGIAVTAPARTVLDCARLLDFEQAVVIADAALQRGMVNRSELEMELEGSAGMWGVARARAVVEFADGRSESPGESRSRVLFAQSSLPEMALQYAIRDERGILVARVDFAIPELRVAGEFDGKVKYGRLLRPDQDPGQVVFEEKQREDAVRDLDWEMVRWIWNDLPVPNLVIDLKRPGSDGDSRYLIPTSCSRSAWTA